MAPAPFSLLLLLFLSLHPLLTLPSPYLSPTQSLFKDYQKMLKSLRIYIYAPLIPSVFSSPPSSLFHDLLLKSSFVTQDPEEAHLFYLPFAPQISTRALARYVREIRNARPYWNRTLGADHFFASPQGIEYSRDRNALELKKNSVQISVFPVNSGNNKFIPHKDITLPPFNPTPLTLPHAPQNNARRFLGYAKWDFENDSALVKELMLDPEFLIEESDLPEHAVEMWDSKFCLFFHGGDATWMAEAMGVGCVPVVIVDRPVQDLPLMDVLRWSEMTILVAAGGGAEGLKEVLRGVGEERYERMRELGKAAREHLVWNAQPQPLDAFHMVMYQLWMRRHTVRYARREWV